jgi:hypothetical protein
MKGRAFVIAVALAGLLLGYFFLPRSPTAPTTPTTRTTPVATLQAPAPTTEPPAPKIETIAAAGHPSPLPPVPDAEQLLRELEPLSITDKPLALSRALTADAQLSPSGVMAEARRALIVTLMVDTERMPEARERAREFIRRYPQSRYLPLVQGTTGIHPRPTPSQSRDAR